MPPLEPYQLMEVVRRKPGMYIGGTDEAALLRCVIELIANSLEEHLVGRGASITVTIHDDGSLSVKDDGGGISVAVDPKHKIPFLEMALTNPFFAGVHPKGSHSGLGGHGVGAKCVNAVSEWMRINTVWEGNEYQISFARGHISEPLTKLPTATLARGTIVRFKPDRDIFKVANFDRSTLAVRLDHLSVLHPGLEFWLLDERPNTANRPLVACFHYPNGISDFLKLTCPAKLRRHPEPMVIRGEVGGVKIGLGFQFIETDNSSVLSFANNSPTCLEGAHVRGFLRGLTDALNEFSKPEPAFQPNEIRAGLNAFIDVWLEDPHYGGSTKDELINPNVDLAMHGLTYNGVKAWIAESESARWVVESLQKERRGSPDADY